MITLDNLKDNLETNKYCVRVEKERLIKYQSWNHAIRKHNKAWLENKDYLVELTMIMHISNLNIGIKNLLGIDVNKVNRKSIILDCYRYAELMNYCLEDLSVFNQNIEQYADLVSPYLIQIDYINLTVNDVNDIEQFYTDYGLLNQLDKLLYERDTYLDSMEKAIIPRTSELINKLELILKEY